MTPGKPIEPINVDVAVSVSIVNSDELERSVVQPYIVPVVGSVDIPVQVSAPTGNGLPITVAAPVSKSIVLKLLTLSNS